MATFNDINQLVFDILGTYGNDLVVYKLQSAAPSIYKEGARSYDAGTTVTAVIATWYDQDEVSAIGRVDNDKIMVTISRKELEDNFVGEPVGQWITLDDILSVDSKYYTVKDIRLDGRLLGDFSCVYIRAQENPDLIGLL